MAQAFATGAIHVFAKPPGENIAYFGTCESMPQDGRTTEHEMLMNDMSGSKVPLDMAFEGVYAQISLVMTRSTQAIVEKILDQPYTVTSIPGTYGLFDVGSLVAVEGLTWEFWLAYSFGAALGNKAAYVGQGLRAGRHYMQCIPSGQQSEEAGTKPMKQHFMLYAWPKFILSSKTFRLYDYDMTGVNVNLII